MRSRTAQWFETRVRYEKTVEDGKQKQVTETYVVDAFTFTEAEAAITNEIVHYVSGDFAIKAISPAPYGEIFFSDIDADDKWYKARLTFITLDEKSGKEKQSSTTYLVQGASVNSAIKHIDEVMGETMIDYIIAGVTETKILDVFEHQLKAKNTEKDDKPEYEEQA